MTGQNVPVEMISVSTRLIMPSLTMGTMIGRTARDLFLSEVEKF
jgi:hypothetical protein